MGESLATFKRFSPSGLVPCLVDSEHSVAVWDSLAIVEYVAETHANVWPRARAARAWARSASAEMHSGFGALRDECSMNCGVRVTMNALSPGLKSNLARLDALWQEGLEHFGGPFLAGEHFTAVDAFLRPCCVSDTNLQPAAKRCLTCLCKAPIGTTRHAGVVRGCLKKRRGASRCMKRKR